MSSLSLQPPQPVRPPDVMQVLHDLIMDGFTLSSDDLVEPAAVETSDVTPAQDELTPAQDEVGASLEMAALTPEDWAGIDQLFAQYFPAPQ